MQEVRRTLDDHTKQIAQVRADVGVIHADNRELKASLAEIKDSLKHLSIREEVKPKELSIQTLLGMAVSALLVMSFIVGGLKYFINSEVESKNILLEYRVAHIESAMSWTPQLVTVPGRPYAAMTAR